MLWIASTSQTTDASMNLIDKNTKKQPIIDMAIGKPTSEMSAKASVLED